MSNVRRAPSVNSSSRDDFGSPAVLRLAVSVGLVTGAIEAALVVATKTCFGGARDLSMYVVWMAPVADMVLFTLIAVGAALVAGCWGRSTRYPAVAAALAVGTAMSLVLLIPGLHPVACLILSLGVAAQAYAIASRRGSARQPGLWRAAAVIGCLVAITAFGQFLSAVSHGEQTPPTLEPESRPNVLLVVLDTEGASSLRLYGYSRRTSDALEGFGAEAVVFDRAYATTSWTLPSHASLFTGRDAHELDLDFKTPFGVEYPTIAEVLGARGYRTAGFVSNLRFTNREFGLARGFGHYEDFPLGLGEIALHSSLLRTLSRVSMVRRAAAWHDVVGRKRAPELTARFLSWVDESPQQPWFAFLNYWDAHEPYRPPAALRGMFGPVVDRAVAGLDYRTREVILWPETRRALTASQGQAERDAYDASLVAVDQSLGKLFAGLRARGVLDRTIVVVTADHGEEHGEQGHYTHAHSLNPNALWVPLVIRFPPRGASGGRVSEPVSIRGVAATILDLGGSSPGGVVGSSLAPLWEGTGRTPEYPVASLKRGGETEYSVIVGDLQYRVRRGKERLTRLADLHPEPVDLIDNPDFGSARDRGRAVITSLRPGLDSIGRSDRRQR